MDELKKIWKVVLEQILKILGSPYAYYSSKPYYSRTRFKNKVFSVLMYMILIVMLFPIVWMVFCSFKGNAEILEGRVGIDRARHDMLMFHFDKKEMLAITSDGAINVLDNDRKVKHRKVFKTISTDSLLTQDYIWLASSNKGLLRISRKNIGKSWKFNLPFPKNLDVNKISKTFLTADEANQKLWVTLGYANMGKIVQFGMGTKQVEKVWDIVPMIPKSYEKVTISGLAYLKPYLYVATNRGVLQLDPLKASLVKRYDRSEFASAEVRWMKQAGETVYWASKNQIYKLDVQNQNLVVAYAMDDQAGQITTLADIQNQLWVGTSQGLLIPQDKGWKLNDDPFFDDVDERGKLVRPRKLISAEVLTISGTEPGQLALGSSTGRLTFYDIKGQSALSSVLLDMKSFIHVRYRNYVDLWNNVNFGLYLRNSFIISGATMFFSMILATLTAYGLVRFDFPGKRLLSLAILGTQMVPGIMFLIPLYIMFVTITLWTGIPIKGTFGGMIFIYSAFFLPFSVWILRGFFAAIPISLEESAKLDGCNAFQVFWKIVLPLSVPGIVATGIFVFLVAWDELMFAWILTNNDTATIPVGIRLFVGNFQNRYDLLMAASTIATLPVMVLFFLLQKHIVSGLTAGAVKG